jgi:hypothetical protein
MSRTTFVNAFKWMILLVGVAAVLFACGGSGPSIFDVDGGTQEASVGPSSPSEGGLPGNLDEAGGPGSNCTPTSSDETGCPCDVGQVHSCYTGPDGTRGVGVCHDGSQACLKKGEFGSFGPCVGETLPSPEAGHCTDGLDNDCNGLTDCADPACINDPACVRPPPPPPPDAGACVPPITSTTPGAIRCPSGMLPNASLTLCCPCQATDCAGNRSCCAAAVCAGAANCTTCGTSTLDPLCNGLVDRDCDDFPEDCDQLCCPCKPSNCTSCPSGQMDCPTGSGTCVDVASNDSACGACDHVCTGGTHCHAGLCH